MFRSWIPVTALLLALPLVAFAEDKKETVKADSKEVHSHLDKEKQKTCGGACRVNFSKELGLSLEYLSGIGHRISIARKSPDPVELAFCSRALGVAERISGKKASITAEQVLTEAVDLAKQRGYSDELSAVALIVGDDAKKDFDKQIALAKVREEEARAATKSGEATKELLGELTVANHTDECIRIFVSGRFVGEVHEGETGTFHVHDHNNPTTLQAYCEDDGHLVSSKGVFGHRHHFHWHIH